MISPIFKTREIKILTELFLYLYTFNTKSLTVSKEYEQPKRFKEESRFFT